MRLQLREEGLQSAKRQRAGPVACGWGRIRVRFQEETSQANRQAGTRQIDDLFAAPARGGGAGLAMLQGMSHVENDRQIISHFFHDAETQHVHHQIVIAETCSAVAEDELLVAGFGELLDDIENLRWTQELRLLDIDDAPRLGQGNNEISLARKEGGQL